MNFDKWINEQENLSFSPKDVIYIGAILTQEAQTSLYEFVSKMVPIPGDWKKFCHHMTIKFKPKEGEPLPVLGEEIRLIVTEVFADERCVAVKVEPNTNGKELHMPQSQIPHVTVATSPGTPPVYSNDLLKGSPRKVSNMLSLEAFVGAKTRTGVMPERRDAAFEDFRP